MMKNYAPAYYVPREDRKAGIILVGKVNGLAESLGRGHTDWKVVAPFNEGRFGDKVKAYTFGKGSQEEGHSLSETAKKEFSEETGINIDRLLRGGPEGYEGVTVVKKSAFYADHDGSSVEEKIFSEPVSKIRYPSHAGKPHELRMYVIEVEGIDKLAEHLKGRDHELGDGREVPDGKTAKDIAKKQGLPALTDLIHFLREGLLPGFNHGDSVPLFGEAFKIMEKTYFAERKGTRPYACENNVDELFLHGSDKELIKNRAEKIRKYLAKNDFINDEKGLKLDHKHRPLRYFQEGADLLEFNEYAHRIDDLAHGNPFYKNAMFSTAAVNQKTRQKEEVSAQTDALKPVFAAVNDIKFGAKAATGDRVKDKAKEMGFHHLFQNGHAV
ncbi:MAG: hypothetical protein MRY32_08460 [Rickettsiales bacterium]|nr:hypothetical protein [Rickettsiales bacterium]